MRVILITGRTIKQGKMVEGEKVRMIDELSVCEMNPDDMLQLDVNENDFVSLKSEEATIRLRVLASQDIPAGIVYTAVTPYINTLIPYLRSARGMIRGKGIEIEVEKS